MVDKKLLNKEFQKDWKKHYNLQFFKVHGFSRKQCEKCKRFFWVLDADKKLCTDSTCSSFDFIGKSTKNYSYEETWTAIEKYFNKTGHTTVSRYPTASRWRDDLYFTNASIIDFQPYVVSGEVKPPANPLIIGQPCIRFNDIENVGITGQHYTSFIMIGQHAFNSKETGLFYWKDEALEHDFNYLTKVIGVKKEDLTFQEEIWAGGGSFGPSIEYTAHGLELGNCVFMQYKETENGKSEELKTKVIDMGAGLERLAWYSNGTPTSYDITFAKTLKKLMKDSGIKLPDKKLLLEFSRQAGHLDVDSEFFKEDKKRMSKELDKDIDELLSEMRPLQALYAISDHLKTVMYTAFDGMLPSNSAGGYNLRLLLRRVFAFNKKLSLNLDLAEVVNSLGSEFRSFDEKLYLIAPTTIDLLSEEQKKFDSTQQKAGKIISSLIEKAGKGEKITHQKLTEIYESNGVPIEDIVQEAEKKKLKIEIPENFYGILAKKNDKAKEKIKKLDTSAYSKTKKLFYEDDELREFTGKVIGILDGGIILNQTCFYAESGGQEGDTGSLNGVDVLDTQAFEGVIIHYVKKPEAFKKNMQVQGVVDWDRRQHLRRHHTATHLINAACHKVLGFHAWQHGAHKSPEKAHLDITHYKRITDEELREIERLANSFVLQNVPVSKTFFSRDEAEKKFGFRIYQGGYVPGKEIRIINVSGIDVEACSGIHVNTTGDIGLIKIIKRDAVQDSIQRLTFTAGYKSIQSLQEQEKILTEAAEALNVPLQELPSSSQKFFSEWKKEKKEKESLALQLLKFKETELFNSKEKTLRLFIPGVDSNQLIAFANQFLSKFPEKTLIIGTTDDLIIVCGNKSTEDALKILNGILKKVKGQGGGSKKIARARVTDSGSLKQLFA